MTNFKMFAHRTSFPTLGTKFHARDVTFCTDNPKIG